jgi:cytochrome c biogenesis protein CcdA
MEISDISQVWLPLVVAALVTASFSLGVSMLTLLSGHLISTEKSSARVNRLSASYIFGFFLAILSSVIGSLYILSHLSFAHSGEFWSILSGVAVGVGLGVMLFYYRWDKSGTKLWLPRKTAEYLYARTKATRHGFEAFILGVGAVVAELIFIAAPIIIAANLALGLNGGTQIAAIALYVLIALVPLLILFISNRRGGRISTFVKWREKNKKFLQIAAGMLLIILGFYLFIYKAM